jgi:hypothetical protein
MISLSRFLLQLHPHTYHTQAICQKRSCIPHEHKHEREHAHVHNHGGTR